MNGIRLKSKHNDQLTLYMRSRGVEADASEKKTSWLQQQDLNLGSMNVARPNSFGHATPLPPPAHTYYPKQKFDSLHNRRY